MATAAQIQAALADAQTNALSWGDKATLLRRAIDNALLDGSGLCIVPWNNVASDGTSIARLTIDAAVALAVKLESLDSGGVIPQYVEFSE